jgi:hypothetical protein
VFNVKYIKSDTDIYVCICISYIYVCIYITLKLFQEWGRVGVKENGGWDEFKYDKLDIFIRIM